MKSLATSIQQFVDFPIRHKNTLSATSGHVSQLLYDYKHYKQNYFVVGLSGHPLSSIRILFQYEGEFLTIQHQDQLLVLIFVFVAIRFTTRIFC